MTSVMADHPSERSVLQRSVQHAPDRPGLALYGAANVVDLPVAAVTHEIVADGGVRGVAPGSVVAGDGHRDGCAGGIQFLGAYREGFDVGVLRVGDGVEINRSDVPLRGMGI